MIQPYIHIKKSGKRLVDLKDENKRTLLSNAAFKGNHQVVKLLIELHRESSVSIYSEDSNGNNPVELACIQGFNTDRFIRTDDGTTYRYEVLKLLLDPNTNTIEKDGKNKDKKLFDFSTESLYKRKKINRGNVPLHWALYWNDMHSFYLLFNENPEQMMFSNDNQEIPFELSLNSMSEFYRMRNQFVSFLS